METLRNLDLTYIVPFKYIFLARLGEAYTIESALFRRYYDVMSLHPNSIVIDIGAHIGTFTVRAAKRMAGKGLVIAIEPEPRNAQYLVVNLNVNKCRNVKVIRAACSDKDGYGFLYLHDFTSHSMYVHSKRKILVRLYRLDTLAFAKQFSNTSKYFIKINAEGAELDILRGAVKTLRHCYAIIVGAHHYLQQPHDVGKFLRENGFIIKIIKVKGNVLVIGTKSQSCDNESHRIF
jgi:FkbM family methyltransferase